MSKVYPTCLHHKCRANKEGKKLNQDFAMHNEFSVHTRG